MGYIVRKIKEAIPKEITCGILRNLTTTEDFKEMDFAHVTITGATKRHYHKRLTECYYVLKGSITVEIDGQREHLDEGSLLMIYPNTKHKAEKISKEDAEILVICSPPWSEGNEILVE